MSKATKRCMKANVGLAGCVRPAGHGARCKIRRKADEMFAEAQGETPEPTPAPVEDDITDEHADPEPEADGGKDPTGAAAANRLAEKIIGTVALFALRMGFGRPTFREETGERTWVSSINGDEIILDENGRLHTVKRVVSGPLEI